MLSSLLKDFNVEFSEKKIGNITNFLTEQVLSRDFETVSIPADNFLETIEQNDIRIVFIETIIYELDHPWFNKKYKDIVKLLGLINVQVIVISNLDSAIPQELESFLTIYMDDKINVLKVKENSIFLPLIINETQFNPIGNTSELDILYFKFGKISHNNDNLKFHRQFKPKFEEWDTPTITSEFLQDFICKIKNAKILYIYHSDEVDINFIKHLELIATMQNTLVVIDPIFEEEFEYGFNWGSSKTNMHYMSTLINNKLFLDRLLIPVTRKVFLNHTWLLHEERLSKTEVNNKSINISVISSTMRKEHIKEFIERINLQQHVNIEVILLTHGFSLTEREKDSVKNLCKFDLKVLEQSKDTSFGLCLNECVLHANHEYITKMDDDDFYYPNYLIDSWIALKYSKAKMVGKTAFFFYLESENVTAQKRIRSSYSYARLLKGNTLFLETYVLKKYMFGDLSRHVDSDLIERLREDEKDIYGFHPYDMCVYRAEDKTTHTYKANDSNFLLDSKILFFGEPNDTIITSS